VTVNVMPASTRATGEGRRTRFAWSMLLGAVVLLACVPLAASDRFLFTVIQMQVAALFALAFNLLWRHTRLLSFGHAAYFGIGMFATIHAMRAAESGFSILPPPLLPLVGAAAGMILGAAAGYFATIRTGTYFAMITLAVAELMYALGPQLETVFGGEMGLSSMRMPWLGLTFASTTQVYFVVLAWSLPAMASLYLFGLTPLGRIAYAIGDDETRVRFLGYDVHATKTLVFIVSAGYSGLAGGLLTFVTENVNYTIFGGTASAAVVLHTFIGGSGMFLGPVIGAAGLTLLGALLADATRLWLLYQGLIFVTMMLFVPEGVAPLILTRWQRWRTETGWRPVLLDAGRLALLALAVGAVVMAIELLGRSMTRS
jgi:branched-chain amino acid transport system permease protein